MANTSRKKYRKKMTKKQKSGKSKTPNKFKLFLVVAACIIIAFFIWQMIPIKPVNDHAESSLNVPEEIPETEKAISDKTPVQASIDFALQRLEIPTKFIHTKKYGNTTSIRISIDMNQISLTICNIFITDTVEEAGGQVIKSDEAYNGNLLTMKIFDPQYKHYYILNIEGDKDGKYENITSLSIIIDDFGYFGSKKLDDFLRINKNITFSILPELPFSQVVMQKADNQDRETMIHIPMEPISYPQNDPGDNAIFVDLTSKEIRKRMKKYLKNLPLCIGANNHMGSLATQHEYIMTPVLKTLKENNLFFVDSRTSQKTIAYSLAKDMGMDTYKIDFFLDSGSADGRVQRMTDKIKKYAQTHREIVVISHCSSKSLKELKQILQNLEGSDIKVVKISDIVKHEEYVL